MPDASIVLVIVIVGIALIFDYVNGFHDAANSIATVVTTRVLTPGQAVVWAAFFNFVAAFTFGTAVAKTIGSGLIDVTKVDSIVIMAGLLGAILWDLYTWYIGLPTSSSHALIGGYAGAAIVKAGLSVIVVEGWTKTLAFIVISPLIGMILGGAFIVAIYWIFRKKTLKETDKFFRRGQLISAAAYSLGHGTNDAQKTMGIIAGVLFTHPSLQPMVTAPDGSLVIPFWIVLLAHTAIGLGTLSGGWRIIHTMGSKITKLKPMGGFAAELAGAVALFASAQLGIPVSTTHTITGAIVGVGSMRRLSAVRWNVAGRIVWAWILTIPASAVVAALIYYLLRFIQQLFS
jgi:inorganic phosphate transporter, PiT family